MPSASDATERPRPSSHAVPNSPVSMRLPTVQVCALDATYLSQPYYGEVAMHFAIIHEDLEMVRLLVQP